MTIRINHTSLLLAGAGGHAKVVADIVRRTKGLRLAGAVDRDPLAAAASGLAILGDDSSLPALFRKGVRKAAVGIGSVRDTDPRRLLRLKLLKLGFELPALVHPSAIAAGAGIGAGSQVMARCVLNPDSRLGSGCVLNTGTILEHDCELDDDVFVASGAIIGGGVRIGAGAFVGLGAVVLQGVVIGERAVIGAGAVVLKDVPAGHLVYGVPAKAAA